MNNTPKRINKGKSKVRNNQTAKDEVKRNSLKPDLAEFLLAIWSLTGVDTEVKMATNESISNVLNIDESAVRQRHNQMKQFERCYVDTFDLIDDSHGFGRYKTCYYLSPSLITLPKTAIMILELLKFTHLEPHQISRKLFIEFLISKYEWEEVFVLGRIEAAIRHEYIIKLTDSSIWRGVRCYQEFSFIELVAKQDAEEFTKYILTGVNNG